MNKIEVSLCIVAAREEQYTMLSQLREKVRSHIMTETVLVSCKYK